MIWTVTARPISTVEQANREGQARFYEDLVLDLMQKKPGQSLAEIATTLNWSYANGEPNKSRVDRTMYKLKQQKLVKLERDTWKLTKEGEKAAVESPAAKAAKYIQNGPKTPAA